MVNSCEKLGVLDEPFDIVHRDSAEEEKYCQDLYDKSEEKFDPLKYIKLPEEFFNYKNVPPPLVSKDWLQLLHSDIQNVNSSHENCNDKECNTEDSISLAELQIRMRSIKKSSQSFKDTSVKEETNEKLREVVVTNFENQLLLCDNDNVQHFLKDDCNTSNEYLESSSTLKDEVRNSDEVKPNKKLLDRNLKNCNLNSSCNIINRKRGRPKKTSKLENHEETSDNIFISKDDTLSSLSVNDTDLNIENWWDNDDSSNASSLHANVKDEIEEVQSFNPESNYQEHDYFKHAEEKQTKELNIEKYEPSFSNEKTKKQKSNFPCMECGKSFSAASTLKYHTRIHNGTLIKCVECDKGFTTNYLLKCHMRIHNGDLFMCHKCGRGFTTAELLKVHSRGHTGDRPFTCDVCGKAFSSASNLAQHKETHDPIKKYLCFQCGSSFSQKRCLDGHMLSHGEKNHICSVCGKLWARKSDLTEHMRVHTGSKPYSCNVCAQRFTQASSLKRHQIVHMEAKPIPCLACGKMFKCEEYFRRHLRKHEKEAETLLSNDKDE